MAKIKLEKRTHHSCKETFSSLRSLLEDDASLRQLDSGYQCKFNEESFTGRIKGSRFEAQVAVQPVGEGAVIQIEVELSFLLVPFKDKVRQTLQRRLDERFGS